MGATKADTAVVSTGAAKATKPKNGGGKVKDKRKANNVISREAGLFYLCHYCCPRDWPRDLVAIDT